MLLEMKKAQVLWAHYGPRSHPNEGQIPEHAFQGPLQLGLSLPFPTLFFASHLSCTSQTSHSRPLTPFLNMSFILYELPNAAEQIIQSLAS